MNRAPVQLGFFVLAMALAACAADERALVAPRAGVVGESGRKVGYEVVDLGTFNGDFAQAFGINEPGTVIGRYGNAAGTRSFSWNARDGLQDLGEFDGRPFEVLRENDHGDMVGWVPTATPNVQRAVLRSAKGEFEYVDDATHGSSAWGISNAGVVVGSRRLLAASPPFPPSRAFLWTRDAGLQELPLVAPGLASGASGIDNMGRVIGWAATDNLHSRPAVWAPDGTLKILPSLGGDGFALATNVLGEVVGHSELQPFTPPGQRGSAGVAGKLATHAFFWSERGGIVDLGTLGGKNSIAWAVGQHHDVYGWAQNAAGETRAFRWTPDDGMVELPGLGGTFSQTGGVNARGMVAAQAADAAGVRHAVVLMP